MSVGRADEIVFFDKPQMYNVIPKYTVEGEVMNTNYGNIVAVLTCLTTDYQRLFRRNFRLLSEDLNSNFRRESGKSTETKLEF